MQIAIVVVFALTIVASVAGLLFVPIGLELSEIVPANTAPHSFFVARERYFSFYPIYAVVRAGFDFAPASNQRLLTNFSARMYQSRFVVDVGSRNDWLHVMTDWLRYAQVYFCFIYFIYLLKILIIIHYFFISRCNNDEPFISPLRVISLTFKI